MWEALRDQPDPVSLEALARTLARHPNTIREQLNWLVGRDLVVRIAQPSSGRGRPAWLYQARGPVPSEDEYVELAAALAWRLQDAPDTEAESLAAGRRWGHDLAQLHGLAAAPDDRSARQQTVAMMETLGYGPSTDDQAVDVALHRCPLLQAAHRFPDVVCTVHRGMVEGLLERSGGDAVVELTPFSAPGECALEMRPDAGDVATGSHAAG